MNSLSANRVGKHDIQSCCHDLAALSCCLEQLHPVQDPLAWGFALSFVCWVALMRFAGVCAIAAHDPRRMFHGGPVHACEVRQHICVRVFVFTGLGCPALWARQHICVHVSLMHWPVLQ
jgi:hypothetical protein